MKNLQITQEIWKEGNMYIAYCPELDIPASGKTISKAKMNLKEVLMINFEEMVHMGTLTKYFEEHGFEIGEQTISFGKTIIEYEPIELQVGVL